MAIFLLAGTVLTCHLPSLASEYSDYYGWSTHASSPSSSSGGPFRRPHPVVRVAPYTLSGQQLQIPLPPLQQQEQTLQIQQEAERRFLQELRQQQARQATTTTTTTGQVAHPGIVRAQNVPFYVPGERILPERLPEPALAPSQYGRLSQIIEPGTLVHATTTRTTPVETPEESSLSPNLLSLMTAALEEERVQELPERQLEQQQPAIFTMAPIDLTADEPEDTPQDTSPVYTVGPFYDKKPLALETLENIIKSRPNTTRLGLSNNALGDEGLARLANSPLAPQITYLDITNTGITQAGIRLLRNFPALRELNISYNHLHNDGLILLANTLNPQQVTSLNLTANFLSDRGLQALSRFRNLRELTLVMNVLSNSELQVLAQAPFARNLRLLNLRYTGVNENKLEELQKFFPKAHIIIRDKPTK